MTLTTRLLSLRSRISNILNDQQGHVPTGACGQPVHRPDGASDETRCAHPPARRDDLGTQRSMTLNQHSAWQPASWSASPEPRPITPRQWSSPRSTYWP